MTPAGYYRDFGDHMDGLVQERGNSIANALELHLSCTNPSILLKSLKLVCWPGIDRKNDSIKSHNLMRMSLLSIIHGLAGLFLGSFDKHGLIAIRIWISSADSRFAPGQWETALLCNDVSHWLGAKLESALDKYNYIHDTMCVSGRLSLCYATLHWHESRAVKGRFRKGRPYFLRPGASLVDGRNHRFYLL